METLVGSKAITKICPYCRAELTTTFTGPIDGRTDDDLKRLMELMATSWHICMLGASRRQWQTVRIEEENAWDW